MSDLKRNFIVFNSEQKYTELGGSTFKRVKVSREEAEEPIKVFCRLRPISKEEPTSTLFSIGEDKRVININQTDETIVNGTIKNFKFSEVFAYDSTQSEIFSRSCLPLISDVFNKKKSGLLFTYGVTNAGKTHTIIGNENDPGLLCLSVQYLLKLKSQVLDCISSDQNEIILDQNNSYLNVLLSNLRCCGGASANLKNIKLYLQSFEIYNEEIYDLLIDTKKDKQINSFQRNKLGLKEIEEKKVIVKDVLTEELKNEKSLDNFLSKIQSNRSYAETMLNSNSSRSHTFFKIIIQFHYYIQQQNSSSTSTTRMNNQVANVCQEINLCIVDLAGSEKAKRTENQGAQLQEACNINKSLLVLGKCIKALRNNQINSGSSVVPYRESKLTRLLHEYFFEENSIIMIANINPRIEDFEESLRVLNYASLAKEIQPVQSKIDHKRKLTFYNFEKKNNHNYLGRNSLPFNDLTNIDDNNSRNNNPFQSISHSLMDEKDLKIKQLEEKIEKLQKDNYVKDVVDKLNDVNDNFAQAMEQFQKRDKTYQLLVNSLLNYPSNKIDHKFIINKVQSNISNEDEKQQAAQITNFYILDGSPNINLPMNNNLTNIQNVKENQQNTQQQQLLTSLTQTQPNENIYQQNYNDEVQSNNATQKQSQNSKVHEQVVIECNNIYQAEEIEKQDQGQIQKEEEKGAPSKKGNKKKKVKKPKKQKGEKNEGLFNENILNSLPTPNIIDLTIQIEQSNIQKQKKFFKESGINENSELFEEFKDVIQQKSRENTPIAKRLRNRNKKAQ